MTSTDTRTRSINKSLVLALLAGLLILTTGFMVADGALDKWVTGLFYDKTAVLGERFPLKDKNPWMWMNENERVFDYALLAIGIFFLVARLVTISKPVGKLWALYGGYIIIVGIFIGIVVVNLIFKDLWGRPRPLQTNLFPNAADSEMYDFYFVWQPAFLIDPSLVGHAKSFPSGHTTSMALYSLLFFVFSDPTAIPTLLGLTDKQLNRWVGAITVLKWAGFALASAGALVMGMSRIVAGKHFASDVLWSLGMVWTLSWICYWFVFRIPEREKAYSKQAGFQTENIKR